MKNEKASALAAPAKGDTAAIAVQAVCTLGRFGGGTMGTTHADFSGDVAHPQTKEHLGSIGVTMGGHALQIYDARDGSAWRVDIAALWRAFELGRLAADLEQVAA
jgi:hypothetical protein